MSVRLVFQPALSNLSLVGESTGRVISELNLQQVQVCEIDPTLADTAAFCEYYNVGLDMSANCVIVEAKRGDTLSYAACMVLGINKVDVNSVVRKYLEARRISFARMDTATVLTGMMYGGITPIGLPSDWPILVDSQVVETEKVIVGSGLRKSKLLVPGELLSIIPNSVVLDLAKAN